MIRSLILLSLFFKPIYSELSLLFSILIIFLIVSLTLISALIRLIKGFLMVRK